MSIQTLSTPKIWLDAFDLTGDMNQVALEYSAEPQENTTFGASFKSRLGGLKGVAMGAAGFVTSGPDQVHEVLFNRVGLIDVPVSIAPLTGAEGEIAFSFLAELAKYAPGGAVGEMFKFTADAQNSSGVLVANGTILHNASKVGSGNGTAFNLGLVGSGQKLYAALHVLALVGTSIAVKIQSDDAQGFPSATDRITFATKTLKGSEWATPVAGPIASDNWWRVNYTLVGSSVTFVVVVGIQ